MANPAEWGTGRGATATDPYEPASDVTSSARAPSAGTPPKRPKWPWALAAVAFVLGAAGGAAVTAGIEDDDEPAVVDTPPPSESGSAGSGDDAAVEPTVVPVGTTMRVGEWEVALRSTTLNANDLVFAENNANEPPVEGRQFVLGELAVTYVGAESGVPWIDLQIRYLGADGNTFGNGFNDHCGVSPEPLSEVTEMFPGASAEANVCVAVASDQVEGGVWLVEESLSLDDPIRFAAE